MAPVFHVGCRLEPAALTNFQAIDYTHLDFLEIDETQVSRLAELPSYFKFSVRMSSHSFLPGFGSVPSQIEQWAESLEPLRHRVLALVMQVPARFTLANDRKRLESVLSECSVLGYRLVVQFQHHSWHQDLAYNALSRCGATLVWTDSSPELAMTSKFAYIESSRTFGVAAWMHAINRKHPDLEAVAIAAPSANEAREILEALHAPPRNENAVKSKGGPWSGNRIIACIDLNAFYPSCEELRDPELKGKPHAVIMTDQPRGHVTRGVVSSCSYEARKFGVRSAMPLAKALTLCPNLILLPVDIPFYSTISDRVMTTLEEFADTFEQASIDEAFLECTGKIGTQTVEEYAMMIKKAVANSSGLLCSVGIAPTKSAAKIACDFRKPDGLTIVSPGQVKEFLVPLEVSRVAGIGPKTELALKDMGITTLGQLAEADVQRLVDRFGKNGRWMWSVANGTDDEQVVPREGHVSLSTEYTLDNFTDDRAKLRSYLEELVPEIYQRAKKYGYAFRTVGIKLVRTDFTIETRETTFPDLQNRPDSIALSIGILLDRFPFDNELKVRKIGIRLTHLEKETQGGAVAQKSMLDYL